MNDESFLDFNVICRTCLSNNNELISVYESNLVEMISACAFAEITINDELPQRICLTCKDLVTKSYQFKLDCQQAELVLKNQLEEKVRHFSIPEENTSDFKDDSFTHTKTDMYNCDQCSKRFTGLDYLASHKKLVHGSSNSENNNDEAVEHANEVKEKSDTEGIPDDFTEFLSAKLPPPLEFQCNECPQSFNVQHDLDLHKSTHSKNGIYICLTCQKRFANRQMLGRHIKIHMIYKPHVCQKCGKGFAESNALTKHLRIHEGKPREKRHFCSECGQGFSEPFYLNVHMRKHTGERPLMCAVCGKSFADPRSLKAHMLTHSGERPYKCEFCGKSFGQNVNLKKHIRIHTGEKPYQCRECGKAFSQSSTLDKHLRVHSGEKPFACERCPKLFSERATLINHIRTHTGERPYICDQCGKRFLSGSELSMHMRKHSGVKRNVCEVCGKDFATPYSLKVHNRTHTGERPYQCTLCNRSFSENGTYRKHLKHCHQNDKNPEIQDSGVVLQYDQLQVVKSEVPGDKYLYCLLRK